MGKIIKLTDDIRKQLIEEFASKLATVKIADGKLSYNKNIDEKKIEQRMTVTFTQEAYMKMMMLVMSYSSEVGWHGLVERVSDHEFRITDIVVYPQYVTGVTVNTDQNEYEEWGRTFTGEQYNKLRFHGHSHVNMSCSPSTVDMTHRAGIVSDLMSNGFYIFMIVNKKREFTIALYDMPTNTLYETADIDVRLEGADIGGFLNDANTKVKTKSFTSVAPHGNYGGYGSAIPVSSAPPKKNAKKTAKKAAVQKSILDDDDDFDNYLASLQHKTSWHDYYGYD